ncbi:hypothetical protein HELRODRAFT_165402 [Helobdella robusta]|uniref:Uncharacterized protein n=1 Tax=Helobdella robusta TaxID=6412 RepID=T1EWQ3_HELRO|nr:hypothetical protein HELRODRAFT_165402 [Helobdella robusta]ESN91373.1 hypothetical protein HELRODRAFT_165402 [Helobdella robusta]
MAEKDWVGWIAEATRGSHLPKKANNSNEEGNETMVDGGFSKLASVLVSDHVSEIILGLDWLVNNKVSWKFDEAQITVGNKNRIVKLVTKRLLIKQETRLADLLWAMLENKLDQQPLQENLVNVKTIIDKLTRDAPEEGRHELSELINNCQDIFSNTDTEIGVAKGVYHRINTEQALPIKQQLRRHSPAHQKVIAKQKFTYLNGFLSQYITFRMTN